MTDTAPLVHVVDDDDAMRDSLCWLIESVGLAARGYATADAFALAYGGGHPGCVLLDIRMPGLSGLDLQEVLNRQGARIPLIFLTGHGDIPMAARAFKAGAFDFLEKPCNDQILLDRIHEAIAEHRRRLAEKAVHEDLVARANSLTRRERQVTELVSLGLSTREIAAQLGISGKTADIHRHNALVKMKAGSSAELASLWAMFKN